MSSNWEDLASYLGNPANAPQIKAVEGYFSGRQQYDYLEPEAMLSRWLDDVREQTASLTEITNGNHFAWRGSLGHFKARAEKYKAAVTKAHVEVLVQLIQKDTHRGEEWSELVQRDTDVSQRAQECLNCVASWVGAGFCPQISVDALLSPEQFNRLLKTQYQCNVDPAVSSHNAVRSIGEILDCAPKSVHKAAKRLRTQHYFQTAEAQTMRWMGQYVPVIPGRGMIAKALAQVATAKWRLDH